MSVMAIFTYDVKPGRLGEVMSKAIHTSIAIRPRVPTQA